MLGKRAVFLWVICMSHNYEGDKSFKILNAMGISEEKISLVLGTAKYRKRFVIAVVVVRDVAGEEGC